MSVTLGWLDALVLVAVLGGVFGTGLWVSWRSRGRDQAADFFLGGRDMAWWAIAGSLFASNIGTEHFVGQAGSGAASGMPVSLYEWTAGWLIVLLGELFAPVYLRARVTTIPEFCERRFSPGTRVLVSSLSLIACIVTKISATIFAGSILLRVIAGWSLWESVPVIVVATALYTVGGGLEAVMYTDVLQALVFVVGGLAGTAIAMNRVGGYAGMARTLHDVGLSRHLHLLRPWDDANNPSTGIFSGLQIASVWYWCIDQVIVQRVLSARSTAHARLGCVAAGYTKLLPPFMMVWPGIAARVLYERCRQRAGGDGSGWCDARLDEPEFANAAYPELIVREFPPGMVGVMVAAMVCAMMSSLSSNFNSASAVLTVDVYKRFLNPGATERQLLWFGRSATAAVGALALLWLPIVQGQRGEFYLVVQDASGHIAPALAVVVTLGIVWPRVNGPGAFSGLLVGSVAGLAQYAVHLASQDTCRRAVVGTTIGGPPLACMHFLHVAVLISVLTLAVTVAVTLCTEPPTADAVANTTARLDGCTSVTELRRVVLQRNSSPHVRMMDGGLDAGRPTGTKAATNGSRRDPALAMGTAPHTTELAAVPPVVSMTREGDTAAPPAAETEAPAPPATGTTREVVASPAVEPHTTAPSRGKKAKEAQVHVVPEKEVHAERTPSVGGWVDSRRGQAVAHGLAAGLVLVVGILVIVFA